MKLEIKTARARSQKKKLGTSPQSGIGEKKEFGIVAGSVGPDETSKPGVPARSEAPKVAAAANAPREDALLHTQLVFTAPKNPCDAVDLQGHLMRDTIALYHSLQPRDAYESILVRLLVGVTNVSMDSLGRVKLCPPGSRAEEINLRYGMKGPGVAVEVMEALRSHRGEGRQSVMVGEVTVEAGGQAIVGNVDAGNSRKQPRGPTSAPLATDTKRKGKRRTG